MVPTVGPAKIVLFVVTASLLTGGALVVALQGGAGPHGGRDYGLDTDGDGRFDWLVVQLDVKVEKTDYYSVWASLQTPTQPAWSCSRRGIAPLPLGGDGTTTRDSGLPPEPGTTFPVRQETFYWISSAYAREFLEAGEYTIALAFPGTDIALVGVDGPYLVQAQVFADGDGGDAYLRGAPMPSPNAWSWEYTTAAYGSAEFEEPRWAIQFVSAPSDRGLDMDGDGLFDYLVVTADVQVDLTGTYALWGSLVADDETDPMMWVTWTYGTAELAAGRQQVEVRFNGGDLWASGRSGAYSVSLTAYYGGGFVIGDPGGGIPIREGEPYPNGGWGDYDVYEDSLCGATSAYRHDQWEERVEPARFSGVFGDRGEDVDGDGLFDILVVDAEVEVTEANVFDFSGQLMSEDGSAWIAADGSQAYLEIGTHTLTLRFPGGMIAASGIDGPYRVDMNLVVAMRDPTATYTTIAYLAADFDPDRQDGTRTHWISDFFADGSAIAVTVTRGDDLLTYVIEDTLYVQAFAADGTAAFEGKDRVYLPTGGGSQSFTFAWSPGPGTYTIVAMLGDPSQPSDAVRIVVTI